MALSYQLRVDAWMQHCFGNKISRDEMERAFRFGEEALELVQAMGATKQEVLNLVNYVFDRPDGEVAQEIGGVMVTLNALGNAMGLDIEDCAEKELTRCWTKVEKIRAKQEAKPAGVRMALPGQPE